MGYSTIGDDSKIMCFNAVKSWKLGWYRDRHVDLVTSPYNWSGNLYGITDYQRTSSSDMMIVRLGSYFVSFNRSNGITQDVGVGENQVLVHQQNDERARSTLLATLQVGESYSVKISPEKAVVISVDYVAFDSEYASVTIETVLDTDTSEVSE
eukprot:CAMPEP_0178945244 /NCGR_PEP_ID=MMETSP0789-20121207/3627_1 /TAXON_ID=3005 /ORGANISM="Rhizosolenia setigera, Strain CCMP 1694" /LENGTH=152 /DNA_ID=CAMNT_0020625113 /DNA_START=1304 /DNA_END=1762 /DNA_ORIENTATION=-